MNHITRLTRDKAAADSEISELRSGIVALEGYLTSDKFSVDPTVQVQDVMNRLREILSRGEAAYDTAWDAAMLPGKGD
jgi:cell division protein YceG involved in septum cleavage